MSIDQRRHLAQNLARLCSYEDSIAAVCRQMSINRSQFNRYLAGHTMPSRSNLRRICDYFGVADWQLLLPPEEAEQAPWSAARPEQVSEHAGTTRYPARLLASAQQLPERYLGYYFRYFSSNIFHDAVTVSLLRISQDRGRVLWKNVELLRDRGAEKGESYTAKFMGEVLYLADRIYVVEHETILGHELGLTTLYPSYRNRISWLTGLQMAVSGIGGRPPVAAPLVLGHLGREIDIRSALSQCGAYSRSNPALNQEALDRLDEAAEQSAKTLTVREYQAPFEPKPM